jgi:hypothetical protein
MHQHLCGVCAPCLVMLLTEPGLNTWLSTAPAASSPAAPAAQPPPAECNPASRCICVTLHPLAVHGLRPTGPAVKNRDGRRLAQQKYVSRQSPKITAWPPPVGWDGPDRVLSGVPSAVGAPGTYNHLTDAVLDAAATRQMYLRRLRTLSDLFFSMGRLQEIVGQVYDTIKDVAVRVRWRCSSLHPWCGSGTGPLSLLSDRSSGQLRAVASPCCATLPSQLIMTRVPFCPGVCFWVRRMRSAGRGRTSRSA